MSKVLKVVAAVAAVAAVVASAGSLAVFGSVAGASLFGVSAAAFGLISTAASLGASLLAPKPKQPRASAADRDRLYATIDPRTPRKLVFGRTAMATDIRDQEFTGANKDFLHRFLVVASHTVNSIQEIWFDDKLAWTSAGGAQGEYNGYLTVNTRLVGNAGNAINISARMGNTRRFTGLAYVHLQYKLTGNTKKTDSPFAQSVPSRMTIIGEGMPCYDPRQDSTIPGGSGAHRANNQATWTYGTHARNPACQMLTYLLGWRINGLLAVGKGIPANRIDLSSFITGANACDESVSLLAGGTEPRYRSDGIFSEADDMSTVLDQFKSTMNAVLDDADGQIRLTVLANDLGAPIATFGPDDVLGDVQWSPVSDLSDRLNIVRGTYTDPSVNSLYQSVDYPQISIAAPDGIDRIFSVDFPLVQSASQAQRLAKQRLQRAQYTGTLTCTMQFTAWRVQKNDVVRLNFPALGFTNKLFRVIETGVRVDGTVPMMLREENAAIYAWDRNEQPAVSAAASSTFSYTDSPLYQDIDDALLAAADAQATADGKIDSYYQANAPTGASEGDYWTDTDDANKLYRYTSGSWVLIRDTGIPTAIAAAAGAQATADGKITTYYSETAPTATALGDLWYKPSTGFVQRWNGTAWADVATLGATIGENVKDKSGNPVAIEAIRNNLALIDWWKKGATIPWSPNAEFNSIISVPSDAATVQPPVAGQADVWFCEEVTGNGEQGGGWNAAPIAFLNPDKAYRFLLPIRKVAGTGQAYWGINGVADANTTTLNTNPYFAATALPNFGRWYLFVGYIFPRNSTGKNSDGAGIWDCKTGEKIQGGLNYCFLPDGTQPTHRAYQYYASLGAQQMFGMPLIEPIESMSDMTLYFEEAARLNNAIGVNAGGQFINPVGAGNNTVVANTQITVDGSGQLAGIGTGNNTVVANTQITVNGSGQLAGIGTGNLTEIENSRLDLAFNNNGVGGRGQALLRRAGGTIVNSTVQLPSTLQNIDQQWNEVNSRPANLSALAGTEDIQNTQITINGSGQVSGIGTGNLTEVGNDRLDLAFDTSGTGGRGRALLRRGGGAVVNSTVQLPAALQNKDITISSGAISGIGTGDGAVIGNDQIQIDASGNFINAAGVGSGTSVANSLVANRLISRGSVATIIEGNSIRRSSGSGDYNAFVSGDPVAGACFAEAIIAGGGYTMVALDKAATSGYYGDQDFVVHASVSAGIGIYLSGTYMGAIAAPSAGQLLRVVYDGSRFQAFVNGVQIGTDYPAPAGQTLFPIFNAYNGPGSYTGLNYGPYAVNSAETKFVVQTASGPALRLIGDNSVIRDAAGDWDSQCYSERGYEGGAFCSLTPSDSSCYFMAGLNSDPTTNASYLSIDYAFYMYGGTEIRIYESGNGVVAPNGGVNFGTWTAGTVLSVIYDNEYVRYLINGDEVRCIRTTAGRKFHFDSSIVQGAAITNLRFGPVTPDASNVDFIHDNNQQSQRGNSVYKNNNANIDWDTRSVSRQVQTGTAFVSAKLSTVNTFFGLKQPSDNAGNNFGPIQASFHRSSNGSWYTWSYGSPRINMGTAYLGVTFDENTEFRITYDGVKLRWYANNTLVDEANINPGITYAAAVVIYGRGDRVDNIQFGPYTDNAWVSVGGANRPEDNATVGARAGTNLRNSNNAILGDNDVITSVGTAAAIAGQGPWATTGILINDVTKPGANLIYNASLKLGSQGWSVNPSNLLVFEQSVDGNRFIAYGPSNDLRVVSHPDFRIPAWTGLTLTLSGEFVQNSATGSFFGIEYYNSAGGYITGTYSGVTGAWVRDKVVGTCPSGTAFVGVLWSGGDVPTGASSGVRRMKLEYENRVTPVFSDEATSGALYRNGQNIDILRPAEFGANVTETRTAAAITGQGPGATAIASDVLNNRLENNVVRVAQPVGGILQNQNSYVAGAIRIQLPVLENNGNDSMIRFFVDVFEYVDNRMQTYEIAGYNWHQTGNWLATSARMIGGSSAARPVRFGRNGGKWAIWIGDAGGAWTYPAVVVRDVQISYSNLAVNVWDDGWVLAFDTDAATNVSKTVSNPNAGDAVFGVNALETWNGAVATLPNFKTIEGTAAAISNQAATATNSDFAAVTGATKPENNATVGATAGTNLRRSNNTVVSDAQVLNESQQWTQVNSRPLLITGDAITADELLIDPSVWAGTPANWFYLDVDSTGFIEVPSGSGNTLVTNFANATPIDHSATYEAEWEILETGGGAPTSAYYTVVSCWDSAGNLIGQDGTYWYYPSSYQQNIGRGSYERRLARFGKGTARPFPANAAKFGLGVLLNYNAAAVATRARRIRARRIDAENLGVNGDASRWQFANNSAIRWSGGSGWGVSTARSKSALVGAQSVSFDAVASPAMCGFTDVANPSSYNDIDYAWYYAGGGALQIYENGNYVWGTSGYTNPDDVRLRIEYDGNLVNYYVNGSFARSVIAGADRSFRVALDNFQNGSGFRNINHVSTESKAYVGVNTYNSTGGAWSAENGATIGAIAGTNLRRSNSVVLGDNDIVTNLGTSAAIANQGALATLNQAAWGSQISGRPAPVVDLDPSGAIYADYIRNSGISLNNRWPAENGANVTETRTAAAINNQGALATRNNARLGSEVVDEGGNAIAAEFVRNNVNRGNVGTIPYPSGGSFAAEVNGLTGAVQIVLPNMISAGLYTMLKFQVDIYNYNTDTTVTYDVSGYVYPANPSWINCTAKAIGGGVGSVKPVRFGRTGSGASDKFCVWIGDTDTVWYYPKVQVRNLMTGYSSIDIAFWQSGWAISTVTTLGSIDFSVLNPTAGDAVFGVNALETWNGAVATLPNFKTSQGTAAAISGQAEWATYTGRSTSDVSNRLNYLQSDGTMRLGSGAGLLSEGGASWLTNANTITANGTAAAIAGQGALATLNSADFGTQVGGSNKPEALATNDRFVDRRNTNEAPSWYLSNYNVRTAYEFKDAFALGVPGNPGYAGFYGALVTTNDYADFSGGAIKQRFTYGSGVTAGTAYVRTGSGSTWSAWTKDFNGFLRPTFDTSDLLETGSTVATVANFKTSQGTASAVTNQGALATKSSVATADIAANAVTNGSSAFGDSAIELTTSWQTMASCTVTMSGGAARVDFCALISGQADASGCPVNIRLLRNGTSIRETNLTILPGEQTFYTGNFNEYSVVVKTPVTGSFPMFLVDTSGATGSVEFVVQLKLGNTNADFASAAHRQIVATEFRR
jgi:hypothetical protein